MQHRDYVYRGLRVMGVPHLSRGPPSPMVRLLRVHTSSLHPAPARCFHASLARAHLMGPPDPVSHLRPVLYDDAPPPPPPQVRHPYSLREFTGDTREYQWKMLRQEIDTFNHDFWKEVRTRLAMTTPQTRLTPRSLSSLVVPLRAHYRVTLDSTLQRKPSCRVSQKARRLSSGRSR